MASPVSLLQEVRGMARDFAVDELPRGFAWDIIDYIPNRRGAKLEARGPWRYASTGVASGPILAGKHAVFKAGPKLLLVAGGWLNEQPIPTGGPIGIQNTGFFPLHNGVMLRDRVYFAHGTGTVAPLYVTWNGTAYTVGSTGVGANPKGNVLGVFKDRLVQTGDVTNPQRVFFSPLETDGGPLVAWDTLSYMDTSLAVTAISPMASQILAFHAKSIEKIRGTIPPGTNLDSDMFLDLFTDQMGCQDPASIVSWQENTIFANSRGVHLTDGATIRSLTDQGSIGDFWRALYARKNPSTYVHAGVFLDFLFVTVNTTYTPIGLGGPISVTLVCNLNERTWFRFSNLRTDCFIESEYGGEEMWMGESGSNRLAYLSPMFTFGIEMPEGDPDPTVDSWDDNGLPVYPLIDLGWKRLGSEGVKRLRHVYVSYQQQTVNPVAYPAPLEVYYETDIRMARESLAYAGALPNSPRYGRQRLNLGRRGYGIQIVVRQHQPGYLSRLYDIAVEEWPQDRGKL